MPEIIYENLSPEVEITIEGGQGMEGLADSLNIAQ